MEESSSLLLKLTQDQNAHVGKSSGCQQLSLSVMQMKMIFSSVQFMHSVMSYSLWPNGLQHARLPCLSPTPGACSNSCPLSRWCHPTISSSVVPFSTCLQSFPASGSFPRSQFVASGGQNIVILASTSVLPMSIQGWFPLGLTGLISLQSKGLSRVFSNTTVQKHQFFSAQLSLTSSSDAVPYCSNSGNVFALNHPHILISGHTVCVCVCESLSHVQLFATLWTVACQAPLSMGFSRQEYWDR